MPRGADSTWTPVADYGFCWMVYPSDSSAPMIATGATFGLDAEKKAHQCVEAVLKISKDSIWGEVVSPNGAHHVCHRGAGRLHWRPMFPELRAAAS